MSTADVIYSEFLRSSPPSSFRFERARSVKNVTSDSTIAAAERQFMMTAKMAYRCPTS